MMAFAKKIGRTRVIVNDEGLKMHDYGHGARIECIDGWNDSCPVVALTVSVEELRTRTRPRLAFVDEESD
jgi:hypothetical protein